MNDIFHVNVIIIKLVSLKILLNYIKQVLFWFFKIYIKNKVMIKNVQNVYLI